MPKITQKNYEAMSIYRLKEKIFRLKSLLSPCVEMLNDALEGASDEDEICFYKELLSEISKELNLKKRKKQ